MRSVLLSGAGVVAIVYGVMLGWLYLSQRALLYYPDPTPVKPAEAGFPDMAEVAYETEDGLTLVGWYKRAQGGKPTLVYFHGNAGNLGNHSWIARPFIDAGYGMLLATYRGYGGNPGSPTEAGLIKDGRAAIRYLREKQGLNASGLVIYGMSLGTGIAVPLAAETGPKGLILQSPFTSIADVGQHHYWYAPVKWLARDRYESVKRIGEVKAPVLVIYAEADRIIPPKFSLALYEAANRPKTIRAVAGAGHNDLSGEGGVQLVLEFLKEISHN